MAEKKVKYIPWIGVVEAVAPAKEWMEYWAVEKGYKCVWCTSRGHQDGWQHKTATVTRERHSPYNEDTLLRNVVRLDALVCRGKALLTVFLDAEITWQEWVKWPMTVINPAPFNTPGNTAIEWVECGKNKLPAWAVVEAYEGKLMEALF